MHLMLHVLKKDIRRLWWGISLALVLQAAMAWFDIGGDRESPDLSPLLLLAWACLIALAIHEDPLVGDRQFWITRPPRWPVLLCAKLLFAAAVIHTSSFLADVVILGARGFRPWEWLASLLAKQAILAMALTLPVIALAAVLRSFAYLALAVIAIGGLTVFVSDFARMSFSRWYPVEGTRVAIFFIVLAVAAAAVVLLQFARRSTGPARALGVGAVLAAELLLAYLPPFFLARARAAVEPARANIAFHLRSASSTSLDPIAVTMRPVGSPGYRGVKVPLIVSGIPGGIAGHYATLALDMIAPGNRRYRVFPSYTGSDLLILEVRQSLYESLKNVPLELKGTVVAVLHRAGASASIAVGANRAVPGAGRCSSAVAERPSLGPEGARFDRMWMVNVVCESPAGFAFEPSARLRSPEAEGAVQSFTWAIDPWHGSLSPLKRAYVSFLVSQVRDAASWKVEITPDLPRGWQVVNLDLHDVRLSDYDF